MVINDIYSFITIFKIFFSRKISEYTKMEDELFNDPIEYLTPTYDNHKNNKNIEIEFRLGKLINNRFIFNLY